LEFSAIHRSIHSAGNDYLYCNCCS